MIPFIVLVPVLIAMILVFLLRDKYAKYIALLGSLIGLALFPFIRTGTSSITWFSLGNYTFDVVASIANLNLLLLGIISVIAPLIILYSFGYMDRRSEQKRFYMELLAFDVAMLTFAMSGSFLTLFIAWEFLSITSYLLIGFWNQKEKVAKAARKALTIVLIGDLAILGSMAIVWNLYGTFTFSNIFASASQSPQLLLAMVLMLIAIMTKSAQFPFHEWLPDAMEGPTPVSAFLHSTTMVKAGVFAFIVMLPLFTVTKLSVVVSIISIITVIIATLNATKELHIKKVIAYSTIQELGLMLFAASSGAVVAAVYFFFAQSFYKALLFFSAGAAMNANGSEDLNRMSGMKSNRWILITTLFGVLSLAGFIPFDGFFSNVAIGHAFSSNIEVYVILSIISFLTSFYIFRWFLLNKREGNIEVTLKYKMQPRSMIMSMGILASLTLVASIAYVYMPGFLTSQTHYSLGHLIIPGIGMSQYGFGFVDALFETVVIALGALTSYTVFIKKKKLSHNVLYYIVYSSVIINKIYMYVSRFVYEISEGVALLDIYISDLFDDIGRGIFGAGTSMRKLANGKVNTYALAFYVGVIVIAIFLYMVG